MNGCPGGASVCETGRRRLSAPRNHQRGNALVNGNVEDRNASNARHIYYDLGCSQYQDTGKISISGGYGSSIPLFLRLYELQCIHFHALYAWEATPYRPDKWWASVPAHVRNRLTFFNEPVSEDSFLAKLRETARPEDFVVLKVDIDQPALEQSLIRRIADDPDLADLIDELYLEYDGLSIADHRPTAYTINGSFCRTHSCLQPEHSTIASAVALMQRLRSRGIRSHFWV